MTWSDYLATVDDSHQMTTSVCHLEMLARAAEAMAGRILELGSHAGVSTAAIALAAPNAIIVSVDLCDHVSEAERVAYWESLGIENIRPVSGRAGDYLSAAVRRDEHYSLIFHDAEHGDHVVPEYVLCSRLTESLLIHDFDQLSAESARRLFNEWRHTFVSSDERGRMLFEGWR